MAYQIEAVLKILLEDELLKNKKLSQRQAMQLITGEKGFMISYCLETKTVRYVLFNTSIERETSMDNVLLPDPLLLDAGFVELKDKEKNC